MTERGTQVAREAVRIPADGLALDGDLSLPAVARGIVLFAHGSGSSRQSARNRFVADVLHDAALGTLLMDLLTPEEEAVDLRTAQLRFDIPMLARRVVDAATWLRKDRRTASLPIGYFGASTGAGAALIAAAERPDVVRAVVSRGGRPDLAGSSLPRVRAPTLLIVGGDDLEVLDMNRGALAQLSSEEKALTVVPGAGHLFEEPGALASVAQLARDWLVRHVAETDRPAADARS